MAEEQLGKDIDFESFESETMEGISVDEAKSKRPSLRRSVTKTLSLSRI